MRVYVATAWGLKKEAAAWAARLEAEGVEITHRWWRACVGCGLELTPGGQCPVTCGRLDVNEDAAARMDLRGVREADVLWLLVPGQLGAGCFWEAGYAQGLKKEIVCSGNLGRTIFETQTCRFDDHEAAFRYLVGLAHGIAVIAPGGALR
jgi:hypothetical protein